MEGPEEDAWGDFKSTPEVTTAAEAPSVPVGSTHEQGDDGEGSELRAADPLPPSGDHHDHHQEQLEAVDEMPSSAAGEEDTAADSDAPAAGDPALAQPSPTAEDAVELKPGIMAPVMMGELSATAEAPPQAPQQQDEEGGATGNLLDMLPSPTAAASGSNVLGGGGDFFSQMGSSSLNNAEEITGVGNTFGDASSAVTTAGAGAPDLPRRGSVGDGIRATEHENAKADDEKIESGWGLLEQPERTSATKAGASPVASAAPAATATPFELDFGWRGVEEGAGDAPLAETTSPPAEKVDGEWIDLAAAPASIPQDGVEHDDDTPDKVEDGTGDTLPTSDEGTAAVDLDEEEPGRVSDSETKSIRISLTADLPGESEVETDCLDATSKKEPPACAAAAVPEGAGAPPMDATDDDVLAAPTEATGLRIPEAERGDVFAGVDAVADADEGKRSSRSSEGPAEETSEAAQDGGLLEVGPLVSLPLQEAGGKPSEGVDAVATVATDAEEDTELAPMPAVRDQSESAVPAVSEPGTNVTAPAADVFDWGDFGGATADAGAMTAAVAAPSESPIGSGAAVQREKNDEGEKADAQGEEDDEWMAFEAPPPHSSAETPQQALGTSLQPEEPGVSTNESAPNATGRGVQEEESDGGATEPVPAASADEADQSGQPESPDGVPGPENTAGESHRESVEAALEGTSAESNDAWGAFGHAEAVSTTSPTGEAAELARDEWGAFGQAETSASPSREAAVEPAKGGDDGALPDGGGLPSDDGDGKAPAEHNDGGEQEEAPSMVPELGGGGGEELSSSSWGAFDEAPLAVAATPPTEAAATPEGGAVVDEAQEPSAEFQEISAATAAEELSADNAEREEGGEATAAATAAAAAVEPLPEDGSNSEEAIHDGVGAARKMVLEAEAEAGAGVPLAETDAEAEEIGKDDGEGDQEQSEIEDEDDDWGSDFGDFEEAPTPAEESAPPTSAAGPATVAVDSPEMGAVAKPPESVVSSPPAKTEFSGGEGVGAAEGGVPDAVAVSTISAASVSAAMAGGESSSLMAVMKAVFNMAFDSLGSAGLSRKAPPAAGDTESALEVSLDSLVDLAHLLRHTQSSRRRREPARLNEWASRCILRGIRPVPDALPWGDGDDESSRVAHARRRSGGGRSVKPQASAAAAAAAATSTAVSSPPASSRAVSPSRAPRRGPTSPTPTAKGAAMSPRVVSPSTAPPPLRKAGKEPSTSEQQQQQQQPPTGSEPAAGTKGLFTREFEASGAGVGAQTAPEIEEEGGARPVVETEATAAASATPSFASFPSAPSAEPPADQKPPPPPPPAAAVEDDEDEDEDEEEFVWGEAVSEVTTPEMPREAPPRVPLTTLAAAEGGNREDVNAGDGDKGEGIRLKGTAPPPADGGDGVGAVIADTAVDDDGGDWSDDPFDSFQSAPAAAPLSAPPLAPTPLAQPPPPPPPPPSLAGQHPPAVPLGTPAAVESSTPSPPQSSWNLDFLMAAPSTGVSGAGRSSPLPAMEAGSAAAGAEGQPGKPLDLVSQALAGFGIDSPDGASDTTAHRKEHGDDVDFFSAFTGRGTGAPPVDGSNSNSNISGGGFPSRGGVKGERDRVSSVDVADLLRATRLRGGARRASRPREQLSAAAESRLAALPDLSYMLSQRICFPMRAALPMPAAAAAGMGEAEP